MITIHGCYRSRALRNIWLCEELGLPFRLVQVVQAYRESAKDAAITTRSPDFLTLNPQGLIPVVEIDGLVMTESLAINLHIARTRGGELGPRDAREDALISQWTLWGATEVEPFSIQILVQLLQRKPEQRDNARLAEAIADVRRPLSMMDTMLEKSPWLVGGRFTVADINVAEVIRYALPAPEVLEAAPRVKAWLAACHARPAWKKIAAEREKEPVN